MLLVPITPQIASAQVVWEQLSERDRGEWILAAIKEAKTSKSEVAERLDISFQALNAWITGDAKADWARRMAVALACDLKETWEPTPAQLAAARKEIAALLAKRPPKDEEKKPKKKPKAN